MSLANLMPNHWRVAGYQRWVFCCALSLPCWGHPVYGLVFEFIPSQDTSHEAVRALDVAGALWSDRLVDAVTLDIGFRFSATEFPGAASTLLQFPYDDVRQALESDQTSLSDNTAVAHLPAGPDLPLLINLTRDSPHGINSIVPYLDDDGSRNNTTIRMTASNAKALGLKRSDAIAESIFAGGDLTRDAVIILNPSPPQPWDFDRTDGIADGHTDFVGIVAHELAHVLGFSSGVDILDRNPRAEDAMTWVNTLDLFRYSSESLGRGPQIIDWTSDRTEKFFSIDGGDSPLARLGTGIQNGDGVFPGHWAVRGTGIMDPVRTPFIGQSAQISDLDILAVDVIGWDLRSAPIPGDFDGDGALTVWDVDTLGAAVRAMSNDLVFDLDEDQRVDSDDVRVWVTELKGSWLGDADLDGVFNSDDLLAVFAAGEYEDALDDNSGWATGDWNADAEFTTDDILLAFAEGGYERGPRAVVRFVPEPIDLTVLALWIFARAGGRRCFPRCLPDSSG